MAFITACKRSCGKAVFSEVFVRPQGGSIPAGAVLSTGIILSRWVLSLAEGAILSRGVPSLAEGAILSRGVPSLAGGAVLRGGAILRVFGFW